MKLKGYVGIYSCLALVGWYGEDMIQVMRSLASYCDEEKLHNITLSSGGNCSESHVSHQVIHDRNPQFVDRFNKRMYKTVKIRNLDDVDVPELETLQGLSHVAVWKSGSEPSASAWNASKIVNGKGWVDPTETDTLDYEVLTGNYVVHFSWFEGNFGHFFDDSLTQIAYIRNQLSNNTKWILCDTPLARSVLEFLDPEFSTRIHWIKMGLPVSVQGTLHVSIPPRIPLFSGCCRPYDHLRQWIAEKRPETMERKLVIYYSRDSTDTHHKRLVEPDHERIILDRIRQAMARYNIPTDALVVFNGQDGAGNTLSIAEQFELFRAARTIIGPHGAGMLGNIVWTNPLPETCQDRTQIIEFIPGINSTQVQPLYRSLFIRWRKWPLDFHVLLYQPESTKTATFIDLDALDDALDDAWGGEEGEEWTATSSTTSLSIMDQ